MGSLSTMHRRGRIPRHKKVNRHPLRKIVGTEGVEIAPGVTTAYEVLECGHRQLPRRDFMGEVPAAKRRCRKCPPLDER